MKNYSKASRQSLRQCKILSCHKDTSFTPFRHCNQVNAVYTRTSLPTYALYTKKSTLLIVLLPISVNWSYANSWYFNFRNVLIITFLTFKTPYLWLSLILRINSVYFTKCDYVTWHFNGHAVLVLDMNWILYGFKVLNTVKFNMFYPTSAYFIFRPILFCIHSILWNNHR